MASIVKSNFVRISGSQSVAKLCAYIDYIQWRPDERKEERQEKLEEPGDREIDELVDERDGDREQCRSVEGDGKELPLDDASLEQEKEAAQSRKPRKFESDEGKHVLACDIKEAIRHMAKGDVLHRFVLSPGDNRVDTRAYVHEVMKQLGQAKGQDLKYVFVVHKNTDHEHAHVALVGRDHDSGKVTISKFDHLRMRAFGDRYLERELGIEQVLDKEMKKWSRDHGINLLYEKEATKEFWNALYVEDKERKDSRSLTEFMEWDKFNSDWKIYLEQKVGREGNLGSKTIYHDLGRQSDLVKMLENKTEIDRWKQRGESEPGLKEVSDQRTKELESHGDFMRELISDKTKTIEPQKFLDQLAGSINLERKELNDMLDKPVGSPITGRGPSELDKMIFGGGMNHDHLILKRDEPEKSIQSLLGLDSKTEKEPEKELDQATRQEDGTRALESSDRELKPEESNLVTTDQEKAPHEPEIESTKNNSQRANADLLMLSTSQMTDDAGAEGFDFTIVPDDSYNEDERSNDEDDRSTPSEMGGTG